MDDASYEPNDPKVAAFLRGYEAIAREHGLIIDSCGCCDSPWVARADVAHIDANIQNLRDTCRDMEDDEAKARQAAGEAVEPGP